MTVIKLDSGAELKITPAPFADAKALYQAFLEEIKDLKLDPAAEVDVNFFKGLFCAGFSSKKVDAALEACMKRVTYNGVKITPDIFEAAENRSDYMQVALEVAKENLQPFTKNLFARFAQAQASLLPPQA